MDGWSFILVLTPSLMKTVQTDEASLHDSTVQEWKKTYKRTNCFMFVVCSLSFCRVVRPSQCVCADHWLSVSISHNLCATIAASHCCAKAHHCSGVGGQHTPCYCTSLSSFISLSVWYLICTTLSVGPSKQTMCAWHAPNALCMFAVYLNGMQSHQREDHIC